MRNEKKLFALLLALAMVLCLAACGTETTSSNDSANPVQTSAIEVSELPAEEPDTAEVSSEEASSTEASQMEETADRPVVSYPLFDDVTTFTLWTSNSPDLSEIISDLNQYVVFEELEKVTNVRWDATLVSFFSSTEQFQLMVASQDYTDVVCRALDTGGYTGGADQAIEEDFLIDVTELIDENMPNLLGWFDTYPELKKQISSAEGNIAGFPKIYLEPSDVTAGGCIRLDWLEELGLETPKTFDDLEYVLEQFRDQKGAAEPLVISVNTGVQAELLNGYNIAAGFYQVDGEVRFGAMQPEFKDYLAMMNRWYQEGLLSDSFLTSQADVLMDVNSILNNQTGVWYGTGVQTITNIVNMANGPMSITGVPYVTVDGSKAHVGEESTVLDSIMWSITTECEDPAAICQYIDYIYGEDGIQLANYGVEGETFNYVDGKLVFTDLVKNNPDLTYSLALNVYTCDRQTPVPFVIDEEKARMDYTEDQMNAVEVWSNATDGLYNIPRQGVTMTTEETEEYNSIYSDIDTYMDESISKFIVGDTSLEEFDAFVAQLETMGIADCIAIEQAAYDRYLQG